MKDNIRLAFEHITADEGLVANTSARLSREIRLQQEKQGRPFTFPRLLVAFCAMALVFAAVLTAARQFYYTPAAYVDIDINPSIGLTLNRLDRVIATNAYNTDGADILQATSLHGQDYRQAVDRIISTVDRGGDWGEDSLVTVTVQANSETRQRQLCESFAAAVRTQLSSHGLSSDLEVFPVSEDLRQNAHRNGFSPAKYQALLELLEADETASLDSFKDETIQQIRRQTRQCMEGSGHSGRGPRHRGRNGG